MKLVSLMLFVELFTSLVFSPAILSASLLEQAQAGLLQLNNQTSEVQYTCYLKAPVPAETWVSVNFYQSPYMQVKLAAKQTRTYLFAADGKLLRYTSEKRSPNALTEQSEVYFWHNQLLVRTQLSNQPLRQQLFDLNQAAGKKAAKPFEQLIQADQKFAREALERAQKSENCEAVRTVRARN